MSPQALFFIFQRCHAKYVFIYLKLRGKAIWQVDKTTKLLIFVFVIYLFVDRNSKVCKLYKYAPQSIANVDQPTQIVV